MRSVLVLLAATACSIEPNYLDPEGPRFAGDHAVGEPVAGETIRVVSYNLAFGREIEKAIAALGREPLAGADVILMQEMESVGVDEIAAALQLRYVYYPASIKNGRDWGNAILSRWPLGADHKLLLPHADPYSDSRRIAVAAEVELAGRPVLIYSTHTATPTLGLGARLDQLDAILEDAGDAGATLIGGDLNTADPGSAGQVKETFADHGFAWASDGATDTGSAWGVYDTTLDYVFARELTGLASGAFDGDAGSDHKPIWVELAP